MKICITGDISLANLSNFEIDKSIKNIFSSSDLVLGNLESTITSSNSKRILHPYYLKGDKNKLDALKCFDAFTLANNHICDYNKPGFIDTIACLKSIKKKYFGAALNNKDAEKPYIFKKNSFKIAVWGVSKFCNYSIFKKVTAASFKSEKIKKEVAMYKSKGYFTIILPHWSYEHVPYPSPLDRQVAKKFIDAGADIIVGSHPHELQGKEKYKNKSIFYSLGNFIFSSKDFSNKKNWKLYHSFFIQLDLIDNNNYKYKIVPYFTNNSTVKIADEQKSDSILNYFNECSKGLQLKHKSYKNFFYKSVLNYRKSLVLNSSSTASKSSFFNKIKNILIKIKYLSYQDLKIFLYCYKHKSKKHEK